MGVFNQSIAIKSKWHTFQWDNFIYIRLTPRLTPIRKYNLWTGATKCKCANNGVWVFHFILAYKQFDTSLALFANFHHIRFLGALWSL